jgi:hypothetical protein
MAHIDTLTDAQLTTEAKQILDEIQQGMGKVPALFKTYAHHPPLLRANWNKLKATMMEGALERQLKETFTAFNRFPDSVGVEPN